MDDKKPSGKSYAGSGGDGTGGSGKGRAGGRDVRRGRPRRNMRRGGAAPGAQPGAMSIPHDAMPPRITVFTYDAQQITEQTLTDVESLATCHNLPGTMWIDVVGFGGEQTLRRIGEVLGIHPLAMADVVNVPQRPKVEDYEDRHLIVTRMARLVAPGEAELEQVSMVLGPSWVCTFQERPGDVFEPVRRRIRTGAGLIRRMGPDYLAYTLLDGIVDGYFPVAESLGDVIDDLEEEVMTRPSPSTLQRIHGVRRMLIALHRCLWRQRDALSVMLRDDASPFTAPVRPYLRDVHDHNMQVLDVIETSRELVVGLMDLYLSVVSNRMNDIMKTLTVMASIFIPLTFIAGVYGMNFDNMPELRWRWAYPALWGVMLVLAVGLLLWFRRKGWLGEGGVTRQSSAASAAPALRQPS